MDDLEGEFGTPYVKGSLLSPYGRGQRHAEPSINRGLQAPRIYAVGYFEAAVKLARESTSTDTAIYPIVYLLHHAIELSIKQLIVDLAVLEKTGKKPRNIHDINELWKDLEKDLTEWILTRKQVGGEYVVDAEEMADLIADLTPYDPEGVAWRFPTDRKGAETHPSIKTVNFDALATGIERAYAAFAGWLWQIATDRDLREMFRAQRAAERAKASAKP